MFGRELRGRLMTHEEEAADAHHNDRAACPVGLVQAATRAATADRALTLAFGAARGVCILSPAGDCQRDRASWVHAPRWGGSPPPGQPWRKLPLPTDPQRSSSTPSTVLAGDRIVTLVDSRIRKMIDFLTASLDPVGAPPKRFSRRYHAGVGAGIDHTVWPVQQAVPESARRALIVDLQSCRELL